MVLWNPPVHNGQEPHDVHALENLPLSPLGNVEQERIKGQEDEADGYGVSQEVEILERPHVDPGGLFEHRGQRSLLRCRIRSAE